VSFHVAAPRTTIDRSIASGAVIPIEQRSPDELLFVEGLGPGGEAARVRVAPPGAAAINPAFDVTPAEFVTGIVTEVGIVPATPAGIAEAFRRGS
jgi:methylthioribose-1-phosphate isomerase